MNKNIPVLACHQLHKQFQQGPTQLEIFHKIDLDVQLGERVAIIGPSGSGKSTLLHLLGGLDIPTSGAVYLQGTDITKLDEKQRSALRNETLGFVYQFHHILPEFTVIENVCMPLLIRGLTRQEARPKAHALLAKMGLEKREHHKLAELSGGERQRTAIARALVTQPLCLLADEPTGNLDPKTAETVYQTILELNAERQTSIIIVTHDLKLANRMDRVLLLDQGHLKSMT